MIPVLAAFPVFALLAILQTAIVSRIPLLQGTADLVLLVIIAWALQERVRTAWHWALVGSAFIGLASALNFYIPLIGYLVTTALALLLRRRIWQTPLLAMFALTLLGTLISHITTALSLSVAGTPLPWLETLEIITLPSLFLNILLAAPVYAIVRDLAEWLHPEAIQI